MTAIEERLRDALRAGASAVTADNLPLALENPPASRGRRVLALAAAAVVLVVAALAVAVTRTRDHTAPPAEPAPFVPLQCVVPLPDTWRDVLRAGSVQIGDMVSGAQRLQGVTASGAALYETFTEGHAPELHRVDAGGTSRVVWHESVAGGFTVTAVSGEWAVLVASGNAGTQEIVAVNTSSGDAIQVKRPDGGDTSRMVVSANPVLVAGSVYWGARLGGFWGEGDGGPRVSTIYAVDLATGERTVVAQGDIEGPVAIGGSVVWSNGGTVMSRAGLPDVPPGYEIDPGRGTAPVTDGDTSVWSAAVRADDGPVEVVRMTTGDATPVTLAQDPTSGFDPIEPVTLAGPYVTWPDGSDIVVLDTRTGAAVHLPAASGELDAAAGGGTMAFRAPVDGVDLAVVRASDLPELHC